MRSVPEIYARFALLAVCLAAALPTVARAQEPRIVAYLPLLMRLAPRPAPPSPSPRPQPTPEPSPQPLPGGELVRWVGEIGGESSAVAVLGKTAYLGEGHRLVMVDLNDPHSPRRAGERGPFPGYVHDLAIADGHAFVAAGEGGLRIMDLADPMAPREIGAVDTPGDTRAVALSGAFAFLADGPGGLRVVDISNPAIPRQVGHLDTVQDAKSLVIQAGMAYLTIADQRSRGMLVVDVSDPAAPREAGALATTGDALGVAVAGRHAYVADGSAGLLVMDVSDSTRPRLVTALRTQRAWAVWIHAGMAFVALTGLNLMSLDLTDPAAPRVIGAFSTDGFVMDLAWDGERLYAADTHAELESFGAESMGVFRSLAVLDRPSFQAYGLAVSGSRAYVMDAAGLRVIDVADPVAPRELGSAGGLSFEFNSGSVAANGDHAYLSLGDKGLHVLDASRPAAPRWLPPVVIGGWIGPMAIQGDHGYLLDIGLLQLLDLAQPGKPVEVANLGLPGSLSDVAVSGTTVYVSSNEGSLYAVDVEDPSSPRLLSSVDPLGSPMDLDLSGGLAYLADLDGNLRVVDVSDPTRMRQVGVLSQPDNVQRVAVAGSLAFLNGDGSDFLVADVSDPTKPRALAKVAHQGAPSQMVAANGFLYVADGYRGFQIFQTAEGALSSPADLQRARGAGPIALSCRPSPIGPSRRLR